MRRKNRVLLIHNIMAPYRFPLFRALAQHPDIELTVWFMSESAQNRRWMLSSTDLGFDYRVLPRIELRYFTRDLFTYIVNYSFPYRYATGAFDVLISAGWLDFACQVGWLLSKLLRRKYILWSESTVFEPSWRRSLAQPVVKTMVSHSDACIAVGTRSKDYLRQLGVSEDSIFTAISTVDVAHFRRVAGEYRAQRDRLKAELGIRGARVVLYVGQFIHRKGLPFLIEAFERVQTRHSNSALVLVGYGPERQALVDIAQRGRGEMHILPHVEVSELPKMYALADIFVLPSLEETWGLVVNEAMACGLPVVVTDRVGASVDLVSDGDNGFVVPAGDSHALAERLDRFLTDPALLQRFGECSARRIERFTPEQAAQSFAAAIEYAVHQP